MDPRYDKRKNLLLKQSSNWSSAAVKRIDSQMQTIDATAGNQASIAPTSVPLFLL